MGTYILVYVYNRTGQESYYYQPLHNLGLSSSTRDMTVSPHACRGARSWMSWSCADCSLHIRKLQVTIGQHNLCCPTQDRLNAITIDYITVHEMAL